MEPEKVCLIVAACAILHNIAVLMNEPMEDGDDDDGQTVERYNGPQQGLNVRDHICNTFFS